ncbi:MAG: hypothetical protein DVS81_02800 [Candidatus Accumulibacter meliphilus]|jgi:hypothetical protein|uniref:Uncharacterized protein n=1 Tax=Candidatus Accumulibacter meliphilus TaxID=2211374 RepID=A0A369XTM8_9PROT|nr:MAG: hypothetical protein DVS81_02800 [Candidatus Accumulibacter meliphilus]
MNDQPQKFGHANRFLSLLIVVLTICLVLTILVQVNNWFEADLKARPEVFRDPKSREEFALVIVLIDPSGSMRQPENLGMAKHFVNHKLIPKCGAGDKCLAYFVSNLFTPRSQVFPGWGCEAGAPEPNDGFQCLDLPKLTNELSVIKLLSKLPSEPPGIRLGEQEQGLINTDIPPLRDEEEAARQNWKERVRALTSPQRREDDYSDICGALEAIGRRLESSTYREKWFIAISDLRDDVSPRTRRRANSSNENIRCAPELRTHFVGVNTVLIVPFDQIENSQEFIRRWSLFFPPPLTVHSLSTNPDDDLYLLKKNPTMGLEEFKRKPKLAYFVDDTPNWLWAAAGLLVAIMGLVLWSQRDASAGTQAPSEPENK